MQRYLLLVIASFAFLWSELAFAKGENEIDASFSYSDRKSQVDGEAVQTVSLELDALYLRSMKSFWIGGEFLYASSKSSDSGYLVLGVPLKYWIKGPESKGLGFYGVITPYLGRDDEGGGSETVLGMRAGPGLAVFLSEMLAVDLKFYYDYRRAGSSAATTTGMLAGFSVFF